jgi:hypothetical protein
MGNKAAGEQLLPPKPSAVVEIPEQLQGVPIPGNPELKQWTEEDKAKWNATCVSCPGYATLETERSLAYPDLRLSTLERPYWIRSGLKLRSTAVFKRHFLADPITLQAIFPV